MGKKNEPATDRQKAYATSLGISYSSTISKAEISALIEAHLDKHGKPAPQYFERWLIAGGYNIKQGQGLDHFIESLSAKDHDTLLCELFAYRIIEQLDSKRSWEIGSNPTERGALREVARELAKKPRAINSIRRFSLKHLVWNPFSGDRRLVGYIEAANLIQERFGIGEVIVEKKRERPEKSKSGCLGVLLIVTSAILVGLSLVI